MFKLLTDKVASLFKNKKLCRPLLLIVFMFVSFSLATLPVNNAFASNYELGSLKDSGFYPDSFSSQNLVWEKITPYIYDATTTSTTSYYPSYNLNRTMYLSHGDIITFSIIILTENDDLPDSTLYWQNWTVLDQDYQFQHFERVNSGEFNFDLYGFCSNGTPNLQYCAEWKETITQHASSNSYYQLNYISTSYVLRWDGDNTTTKSIVGSGSLFNFIDSSKRHEVIVKLSPVFQYNAGASISDVSNQIKSVNQTQLEQIKQDNDQYEQEKKEESDREQQGNADADEMVGIFNFQFSNPVEDLFNAFKPRGCVSVPTLARLINSPSSTYCSWFPSSITSILTPAFSSASMMLLIGFFIRWLNSSGKAFDT